IVRCDRSSEQNAVIREEPAVAVTELDVETLRRVELELEKPRVIIRARLHLGDESTAAAAHRRTLHHRQKVLEALRAVRVLREIDTAVERRGQFPRVRRSDEG